MSEGESEGPPFPIDDRYHRFVSPEYDRVLGVAVGLLTRYYTPAQIATKVRALARLVLELEATPEGAMLESATLSALESVIPEEEPEEPGSTTSPGA